MIVAIIQARMGSTRLPGKVLKTVAGEPLLKIQINRIRRSKLLDKIVVATSYLKENDIIENLCNDNNIACFRGSENDVLERYYQCAREYKADTIVRLTADCPLSDPEIIDKAIFVFNNSVVDYLANTVPFENSKYPDGMDVEVFSNEALEKAHKNVTNVNDREHVTFYFWKYKNNFKTAQLNNDHDYSGYRFTVDYPEDLEVVEFILKELEKRKVFGYLSEIIEIIDSNLQIKEKNSKYYFGIGWKSEV